MKTIKENSKFKITNGMTHLSFWVWEKGDECVLVKKFRHLNDAINFIMRA